MDTITHLEPVYRKDDGELVGFIREIPNTDLWECLTIFHSSFDLPMKKEDSILNVLSKGLHLLTEKWEFYSEEDKEWYICTILEANAERVKIKEGYYSHGNGEVHEILSSEGKKLRLLK
jgi:hypothetical protein